MLTAASSAALCDGKPAAAANMATASDAADSDSTTRNCAACSMDNCGGDSETGETGGLNRGSKELALSGSADDVAALSLCARRLFNITRKKNAASLSLVANSTTTLKGREGLYDSSMLPQVAECCGGRGRAFARHISRVPKCQTLSTGHRKKVDGTHTTLCTHRCNS